jgi:hypothetical protein
MTYFHVFGYLACVLYKKLQDGDSYSNWLAHSWQGQCSIDIIMKLPTFPLNSMSYMLKAVFPSQTHTANQLTICRIYIPHCSLGTPTYSYT